MNPDVTEQTIASPSSRPDQIHARHHTRVGDVQLRPGSPEGTRHHRDRVETILDHVNGRQRIQDHHAKAPAQQEWWSHVLHASTPDRIRIRRGL